MNLTARSAVILFIVKYIRDYEQENQDPAAARMQLQADAEELHDDEIPYRKDGELSHFNTYDDQQLMENAWG